MKPRDYALLVDAKLALLKNIDLGYELGENKASPPAGHEQLRGLPHEFSSPLRFLYESVGAVSAPDLWNGIFIFSPEVAQTKRGIDLPSSWRKRSGEVVPVFVFGTDGGGGMLSMDDSEIVWHLPIAEMREGIYLEREKIATRLGTIAEFLGALIKDIEKFIEGDQEHSFIGRS